MSGQINDSAGGPATPTSVEGALTTMDNQYNKAIFKGEIKTTKLATDNYESWADSMQLLLEAKMLWPVVSGEEKIPDARTRPIDYRSWKFDDTQARAWIHVNMEDSQHSHTQKLTTSYAMWQALKKVHGALGLGRLNFLKTKFYAYQMGPTETIDEVSSALSKMQMQMSTIIERESPTDRDIALRLIQMVKHEAYNVAKYLLLHTENLTLEHAKGELKTVEQEIKDNEASEANDTANQVTEKKDRKCFHCGKTGHIKLKCFKWLATDEGKQHSESQAQDSKPSANQDKPKDKRTRKGEGKGKSGSARAAADKKDESSDSDEAWMVRDQMSLGEYAFSTKEIPEAKWIIDSGATRHMTPDESLFINIRGIKSSVTVANGQVLKARGVGDIRMTLNGQVIKMTEVLLVPGLDANLLSISALNRKGFNINFTNKGVFIRAADNTLVATGIVKGRMYLLQTADSALLSDNGQSEPPISESGGVSPTSDDSDSTEAAVFRLWHERLGHVGPARVKSLAQHTEGIDQMKPPGSGWNCSICNFTKLIRKVNRETPKRASRKLGRVHTDVWGPFKTPSLEGSRYFISLIDDLTRKSWISCVRTRMEIYQKIKSWHAAVSLETGETAAIFRSDNAKEYKKFEKILQSEDSGTRMEFTTPYTPEENGVAERFNRTIIQMARAMLMWAELPHRFWGEAVCTANYLRNLMPAGRDEKSPNELWSRHKPDVSHIRKFGCLVYAHIPSSTRGKLDAVSFRGIFVGYHSTTQVRVYEPKTQEISWHTAVKFLENSPGGRLLKGDPADSEEEDSTWLYVEDEDEDENVENVENRGSGANLEEIPGINKLVENGPPLTHESSGSHETPTDQTAPKSRGRGKPTDLPQPTRKSARLTKPYQKYQYDNDLGASALEQELQNSSGQEIPPGQKVQNFKLQEKFEPSTYQEAITCTDQRLWKSTYGHTLLIGNGAVTWASKKQRTTSSSTNEAEYVSMCQVSKTVVWATRLINELNFGEVSNLPIRLLGDNQDTLDLIKNPEHHSRTKHIDVQYHYIREVAEDGLIKTGYVSTKEMVADVLTKPTKPPVFISLREKLGLMKVGL